MQTDFANMKYVFITSFMYSSIWNRKSAVLELSLRTGVMQMQALVCLDEIFILQGK